MELFKNGYIVVSVRDYNCFSYDAWPLKTSEDETAMQLTEEADERWFIVYDMQEIAPACFMQKFTGRRRYRLCQLSEKSR